MSLLKVCTDVLILEQIQTSANTSLLLVVHRRHYTQQVRKKPKTGRKLTNFLLVIALTKFCVVFRHLLINLFLRWPLIELADWKRQIRKKIIYAKLETLPLNTSNYLQRFNIFDGRSCNWVWWVTFIFHLWQWTMKITMMMTLKWNVFSYSFVSISKFDQIHFETFNFLRKFDIQVWMFIILRTKDVIKKWSRHWSKINCQLLTSLSEHNLYKFQACRRSPTCGNGEFDRKKQN